VRDPGNRHRRRQHQPDGEQEYRPQIPPKITPRREQSCGIKQRWENEVEYDVRIESHLRQSRHETQSESANDEHDRIRQGKFACDYGEKRYRSEQQHNDFAGLVLSAVALAKAQDPTLA
jgi:hypothetical protein